MGSPICRTVGLGVAIFFFFLEFERGGGARWRRKGRTVGGLGLVGPAFGGEGKGTVVAIGEDMGLKDWVFPPAGGAGKFQWELELGRSLSTKMLHGHM